LVFGITQAGAVTLGPTNSAESHIVNGLNFSLISSNTTNSSANINVIGNNFATISLQADADGGNTSDGSIRLYGQTVFRGEIGFDASDSNAIKIMAGGAAGFTGSGVRLASGATTWGTFSDARLKTNWQELTGVLPALLTLEAGTFSWSPEEMSRERFLGLKAQQVEQYWPEAIDIGGDENQTRYLKYTDMVPVLVKAIQELSNKLDTAEARIAQLEAAP